MFITGGIILVKVYQNRHPHVQANAFIAFFAFAIIIFFTLIGLVSQPIHGLLGNLQPWSGAGEGGACYPLALSFKFEQYLIITISKNDAI